MLRFFNGSNYFITVGWVNKYMLKFRLLSTSSISEMILIIMTILSKYQFEYTDLAAGKA